MFHLLVHQDFLPKETNRFMGRGAITYHSCLFTDGNNWGGKLQSLSSLLHGFYWIRMARGTIECLRAIAGQLPASQDPLLSP